MKRLKWFLTAFLVFAVLAAGTPLFGGDIPPLFGGGLFAKAETANGYEFSITGTNATITKFIGSQTSNFTIPDTLGSYKVVEIGASAFAGKTAIKNLIIPESVETIGNSAFSGCTGLTSVTIGDSVTKIGDSAFAGCSALEEITIPGAVTSVGAKAFENCTALKKVTVGSKVTSLNGQMFSGCLALTTFAVASGSNSFAVSDGMLLSKDQKKLIIYPPGKTASSFTVPSTINALEQNSFVGCKNLRDLTVPASVTSLHSNSISGCFTTVVHTTESSPAENTLNSSGARSQFAALKVTGSRAKFEIQNVMFPAGSTVTVTVSIVNNPGIDSAEFTVYYGTALNSKLTLDKVEDKGLLKGFSYTDSSLLGTCAITYSGTKTNVTTNGVVLTLTFKMKDGFTSGSTPLTFLSIPAPIAKNANGDSISFMTNDGSVSVGTATSTRKPGDVNGDGVVDAADGILLTRYVAGWKNVTIVAANADVNGDGKVDETDAVILKRYLAGWPNVTLK
ncbi:MAG: leucine-rich repeat protein [Oscillospiraceae bacterium]|nr:leucine-rich repeat protein [Oscillospiraceae bacterium]